MPEELAIGNTIYSCTFFKEINSDGSFHVPEDFQHDLLYWLLNPELFCFTLLESLCVSTQNFLLLENQCVSTLWTIISTQACSDKPMFGSFVNIFWQKHINHTFFFKFSMACTSQPPKKIDEILLFKPRTLWFATILNSPKQIFLGN